MNGDKGHTDARWRPALGSWEEAMLSWQEQVETAFRVRALVSAPRTNGRAQMLSEPGLRPQPAAAARADR